MNVWVQPENDWFEAIATEFFSSLGEDLEEHLGSASVELHVAELVDLCRYRNNLDLLFFNTEQLRYVVVELKTGKFKPDHSGQLGFYVALVDERLRRPQHAPTVGTLLCSNKNDSVVRYALAGRQAPIAVSRYDLLRAAEKAALPSEDQLTRALKESNDE